MEPIEFTHDGPGGGIHIEGYPDPARVIELMGEDAADLADFVLHSHDIRTALQYLDLVNKVGDFGAKTGLFEAAVTRYFKCFQWSAARNKLDSKLIYAADEDGLAAFNHLANMRNKTLVYDENPFTQCLVGAVLNHPEADFKIAKVVNLMVNWVLLAPSTYNNLHTLCTTTLSWIEARYDALAAEMTSELEALPYPELDSLPALQYNKPSHEDVGRTRLTQRSPRRDGPPATQ